MRRHQAPDRPRRSIPCLHVHPVKYHGAQWSLHLVTSQILQSGRSFDGAGVPMGSHFNGQPNRVAAPLLATCFVIFGGAIACTGMVLVFSADPTVPLTVI